MNNLNFEWGGRNGLRPEKASSIDEILAICPTNKVIIDNYIRAWSVINDSKYKKIVCSISGGSDSDIMLDIIWRCDRDNKVDYVWFNTGLEYQATKDHLQYLNEKYNISIIEAKPVKSIPLSCRTYGQPFVSKRVSNYIHRLQGHNFKWEDKSFDELYVEYPKCKSALKWWCNIAPDGQSGHFIISNNKYLKEFMIQNPPTFKISDMCCDYAKKNVSHNFVRDGGYDLSCFGVRKAEGGARATAYNSCFGENKKHNIMEYRPIFWYLNADKEDYERAFSVVHSDCYSQYGLTRTGCVGCPFNRNVFEELNIAEQFEPKLYKAVCNIFRESYEYTKRYREFAEIMKEKEKSNISEVQG